MPNPKANQEFTRNIDFPFNLGYNNQPIHDLINKSVFTNKSKVKMLVNRRRLEMKFITHYVDLLKSIKGMQYEAIE